MMSSDPAPFIPAKLDDADLTAHEFRVFCHISRRGECYASLSDMSDNAGVSKPTLRDALKTLERASMIQVERNPGTTDTQRTLPPEEWDLSALNNDEEEDADEGEDEDDTPEDITPPEEVGDPKSWVPPPKDFRGGSPQDFGGASKGNPVKGNPLEGDKDVSAADAPLPSSIQEVVDLLSWEAEPLPDDHPARWDHLPGDWTFDFALAALEHFRELDLLATPTERKIDREGEQRVAAQWGDTFRLLKEQDGYSRDEIKSTMQWLFDGGNFWVKQAAIRSVPPLRSKTRDGDATKFDVMHQQAKNDEQRTHRDAKQRPEEAFERIARAARNA